MTCVASTYEMSLSINALDQAEAQVQADIVISNLFNAGAIPIKDKIVCTKSWE